MSPRTLTRTLPAGRARLLPVAHAAALAMAFGALGAQAQQAEPKKDDGKVETVVITATKRIQPLQATPIAVSVISGGSLEEANLNNLSTITQQLPTVNFRSNASNKDTNIFIRGVGTVSTSSGVEPTVSTVIDGVVTFRAGQSTLDLAEVDRIEVLRGPQGTLFGKNASAGAINIVTRSPGKGLGGYVDLSAFEGGEHRVRLGLSGGNDLVRGSVSVLSAKYDGNVTNVFDGSTVNGYDRNGVRGRLEVTPSRDLKITLIADHSKSKDTTPTGVVVGTDVRAYPTLTTTSNPLFAAAVSPVVPGAENRRINSNMKTRVDDTNEGLSAQVDWSFGGYQVTSITAHRKWQNTQFQDQDRLPSPYRQFAQTHDRGDLDFSQNSQELRIASTDKRFFDFVAGLFYIEGKTDEVYRRELTRCNASVAPPLASGLVPCTSDTTTVDNGVGRWNVKGTSQAIFGEGTLNFSQQLRAIAGLRYTRDELSYAHARESSSTGNLPGIGIARSSAGSTSANAVTGRVGPQFQLNPDVMLYATYSRGYKGPAYNVFFNMNADGRDNNPLAPERANSYEAGVKSELLDRRLRLNVAAFQTTYTGFQANVFDTLGGTIITRTINAGDVETKGVEVDLTARPIPELTLNVGLANIQARIKKFNCPPNAAASCDVNGKPLPFSPDWKGVIRAKYTQGLGNGLSLEYGADYTWQSKTNFSIEQQPDSFQKAYGIINANVALISDAGWRVSVIGKNLADTSYSTLVQNNPGAAITRYVPRDDQRYFGVNLRYDF